MSIAIILEPPSSRFDAGIEDKASEMSGTMIKSRQQAMLGKSDDQVLPMEFFVFRPDGKIAVLSDAFMQTVDHPTLDHKDQLALMVKIMVHVMKARCVLQVTEAYIATRCHNCGSDSPKDAETCTCGASMMDVPPSENPYRTEVLMSLLSIFGGKDENSPTGIIDLGSFKLFEVLRGDKQVITGFNDMQMDADGKVAGRFCEHWLLEKSQMPHFLVNLPNFCRMVGEKVEEKEEEIAALVESTCPSSYQLLKWIVAEGETAIKLMEYQELCRQMNEAVQNN